MLRTDPPTPARSRRPRWAIAAIVTAAALGGSLLVAGPASADPSADVGGTVRDYDGHVVAGVAVAIAGYDPDSGAVDLSLGASAVTDSDGHWSITGLPDGKYSTAYEPEAAGPDVAPYAATQWWDGGGYINFPEPQFTVSGGVASSPTIDETLARNAGVLTTTVKDGATGALYSSDTDSATLTAAIGFSPDNGIGTSLLPSSDLGTNGVLTATHVAAGLNLVTVDGDLGEAGHDQIEYSFATVTAGTTTDLGQTTLWADAAPSPTGRITGEAKVGSQLTASLASIDGVTYSYQWFDVLRPIFGATSQTYVPTANDLGSQIVVLAIAHQDGKTSTVGAPSTLTKPVKIGDANAGTVAITGAVKYGQTVSASVSTALAGANKFQWNLNGNPIAGADGSSYAIRSTDVGNALSVAVTSTVAGHTDAVIPSASVVVAPDDANTGSITITGSAKLGKTVKASVARALPGVTSSYRWFRNGVLVGGVDGSSYTIAKADLGTKLTVSVTAAAQGHADSVLVSAPLTIAKDTAVFKATSAKATTTKKQLKVSVSVKPGKTKLSATAKVKVYYSSKKFKTVTVKSGKSTSVKLPKLTKGKHTVKVVYLGNASYAAKTVTLKVKVSK